MIPSVDCCGDDTIPLAHRNRMCELAVRGSEWIDVVPHGHNEGVLNDLTDLICGEHANTLHTAQWVLLQQSMSG